MAMRGNNCITLLLGNDRYGKKLQATVFLGFLHSGTQLLFQVTLLMLFQFENNILHNFQIVSPKIFMLASWLSLRWRYCWSIGTSLATLSLNMALWKVPSVSAFLTFKPFVQKYFHRFDSDGLLYFLLLGGGKVCPRVSLSLPGFPNHNFTPMSFIRCSHPPCLTFSWFRKSIQSMSLSWLRKEFSKLYNKQSRGGDLIAIICHFLSFHMGPSVLYSSLVIQNRIKKNFWKKMIFKPPTAP